MRSFRAGIGVLGGAAAGAIVAVAISHGNTTTKTVTDLVAASGRSVPVALSHTAGALSINQIYRRDSPGVVDIDVSSVTKGSNNSQFPFFGTPPTKSEDEGAGVVLDKQGDIITDEHVVAHAQSVTVHFQDGTSAKAKVLGTDPSTDVGVIKVEGVSAAQLHPIPFANSASAEVGDPVVAIGSPFGLPETVTAGIVSQIARTIEAPSGWSIPNSIQTDAAINPGNSGGPLLNARGNVLGLNDQIQTNSDQSSGVGFATPGNTDLQVANDIIAGRPVKHPWVGVGLEPSSTGPGAEIAPNSVTTGSPAATAGLEAGDVITAVNHKPISDDNAFISAINRFQPGQTVTLSVRKPNAAGTASVKVTLGNRPPQAPGNS